LQPPDSEALNGIGDHLSCVVGELDSPLMHGVHASHATARVPVGFALIVANFGTFFSGLLSFSLHA